MLIFHFCKKFIDQIEGQNFKDSIYNKISENKKRKDLKGLGNFACFRGSVHVLKVFRPNTRTIIEETNIRIDNEDIQVFFVRELISGQTFDYVYSKTIYPQLRNGEWIKNNPLPQEDKNNFIEKYQSKTKSLEKKEPPKKLTSWLKEFKFDLKNEIFETESWVKYALNSSLSEGMNYGYVQTFRIILNEIIESKNNHEEVIKEENGIKINKYTSQNVGILYSKIQINTKEEVFILYNAAHIEKQKTYWQASIQNIKSLDIGIDNNIESIRRKAFRAYPKWTIGKDDLWLSIQKSTELNNLSLTLEQINFFEGFKFPYYINGQAGSGKSTMLYYLFANSYFYKYCGEIDGEILFLTESEALLEHSKKNAYDLLINNPQFELKNKDAAKSKTCFHSFKNFLLSLLPDDDRHHFNEKKYLNFSTFKYLYENSNIAKHHIKNYSAEESWFTIITYIYGYDSEQKITSKNYLAIIPNKSQVIPKDKFEGIEKVVLPFYERLINIEGYWDKLKIIKYIDENINFKTKYSVLICDEAQDFSRVELRFILRLSEYLNYNLSETEQVPIVFAGDPNQTVNPTGFRQGEMTSMLHEELQQIAKFKYDAKQNLYNPAFNYRSTQPVVSLANFVQYHRMKNLGIKQVRPQEAKRPSLNSNLESNTFLSYKSINENKRLQTDLIQKLKYKIFIVPVDAQEKENYIKEHNFLSLIDELEIKTSVEAKGAEYEQVVLFGFGEYFIDKFKNLLGEKKDTDEQFRRGYFFNKLYVGLTRAQTELIIIDNEIAENDFWKKLVGEVSISNGNWETLNANKATTINYNPGSVNDILQSTYQDAEKNAEEDKKQGIYDQNPARLKVAANQFSKLGNKKEAIECQAIIEEIKQNWNAAADEHLKNSEYEKAAICLFKGRHFKELVSKIGNNLKNREQDIRLIISRLMNGEIVMKQDIDILNKNKDVLEQLLKELEWREDLINKLISNSKSIQIIEQKKDFVQILEFIANSDEENLWKEIGNIRFDLKQYKEAIDAWNQIELFDSPNYCLAQVQLAQTRKDFENVILYKNELLKYIGKQEKALIFNEIIAIYASKEIKTENYDFYLAVYRAFLIHEPHGNLVDIGIKTEEFLTQNLAKIESFYLKVIKGESLQNSVKIFILERWAKTIWKNKKSSTDILWLEKLNNEYSQLADNQGLIYKPFDLTELENITEYPQAIQWKPALQFKKISIKNFRRFEELQVKNIGQYNLIVGDNNVGKTSLLEALLFSHNKDTYFQNLVFAFIERENTTRIQIDGKERYQINNYKLILADFIRRDTKEFEFELSDKRQSWNFKIRRASLEEVRRQFPTITNIDVDEYLCLISDTGELEIIELALIIKKLNPSESINSPLIPFGKGFGRDLALAYHENIEKVKANRKSFITSMKTFIPNIERISVDTANGDIDIEESNFDTPAPLHQYGEGANKLFRILVQMILQENKVLLIDEIDAGIHYSRFAEFWKVILHAANLNKVQLFATTHNIECVKYFEEILQEDEYSTYQDKSRIITLRKLPDKNIKAYTRFFNEFEYELDNEFEIRGGEL